MSRQLGTARRSAILNNVVWFLISLALAFFVWMTAVSQSDPVEQWRLTERVPIRVTPDAGMIITNAESLTSTASVQIRAQRSVRQLLAADDVVVYADLTGLGPGTYTVPLQAQIARDRRVVVTGISPSQITVNLELEETKLVPVTAEVVNPPPLVVSAGEPQFDVRQVAVSGPSSRVQQVVAAQVEIDLANQRTTFSDTERLLPVDADGNVITGVNVQPSVVQVTVEISPNSDVREVRVQPNPVGSLPEGYVLTSFDYDPKVVYVSGPVELLENLPGTLFTTPINLSGRTASFQQQVTVELPDPELVIITGGTITVSVGIGTQTVTRQFDQVPIEVIGSRDTLDYELDPTRASVLVTGPQPVLQRLTASDVRVIVDVSGLLNEGSFSLTPVASIGQETTTAANISVLPAQIDVTISRRNAPPQPTGTTERTVPVIPTQTSTPTEARPPITAPTVAPAAAATP